MEKILVATDFSERSDRAIRRAVLLAKKFDSTLSIVHVIDDDRPKRIVSTEWEVATVLLTEQTRSLCDIDNVTCDYSIVAGDPFEGIVKAADELMPDILVVGPYRRQILKDVFIGTTAERVIRASRQPILMANGVPAGFYRHALIALDFSDCSADAVRVVQDIELEKYTAISVVHVFDTPGAGLISRSAMTEAQVNDYLEEEQDCASREMAAFLSKLNLEPVQRILRRNETSIAAMIYAAAKESSADLLVIGSHGRSGITKMLLGSVAGEVLRSVDLDVLVVPPR
ncbi:MAG: universal stress protein [Proteobacteria bacterium]|nr:MAG: universal stress protein [Pseudomonadota bacterium]